MKSGDVTLSSYLLRKERLRTSPNVGRSFNQERDVSVMPVTRSFSLDEHRKDKMGQREGGLGNPSDRLWDGG